MFTICTNDDNYNLIHKNDTYLDTYNHKNDKFTFDMLTVDEECFFIHRNCPSMEKCECKHQWCKLYTIIKSGKVSAVKILAYVSDFKKKKALFELNQSFMRLYRNQDYSKTELKLLSTKCNLSSFNCKDRHRYYCFWLKCECEQEAFY